MEAANISVPDKAWIQACRRRALLPVTAADI
jgi:hypothetical protein